MTELYVDRMLDGKVEELLAGMPAIMLVGPRASGKTTSAKRIAKHVMRLDDPAQAGAVAANPDEAIRRYAFPLLIDEWQEVPEVLGAIKRAVDDDPTPGRFLLTGSVEGRLEQRMWPATGRVVQVMFHGLTQREIQGRLASASLLQRLAAGNFDSATIPNSDLSIDDYVGLALAGSFPEPALRLPDSLRRAWFDAYVENVVTRDVKRSAQVRDPEAFRTYFEVLALSTAGLASNATLFQAAQINQRTAENYDALLKNLYLLHAMPAWSSNRLTRLAKRAKRYIVDAGLAASAARIDTHIILSNGDLMGRIVDTFVLTQLRPEAELLEPRARLHHVRDDSGRLEIDALVDLGHGRVIGVEVKASSTVSIRDAKHLSTLKEKLGDDFVAGVVFHTGPAAYTLTEKVFALPISALWN